jgi:anti-sigma factor RsiW
MHSLVKENLEGYLSERLPAGERQRVEAHLAECAGCRRQWDELVGSAELVRQLRPPQDAELEPAPGFYARLMERIESSPELPFWNLLLEPMFGRRLVFACLMLLALLGAYVVAFAPGDYPGPHRPEAVLADRQQPPVPAPRLGPDLNRNRDVVLVTLVSGE